jgi:ankyrin repeat protein
MFLRSANQSPLWVASQQGHVHCVDALIEARADVNDANM